MILMDGPVDPAAFEAGTGWAINAQGACNAELCVPLPPEATVDGAVDVDVVAGRLGMPVVHDDAHDLVAVGPATSVTGRALSTARAPALQLPDFEGHTFDLASLRGQKVILLAWASW
jgi:hypothetical protein